MADNLMLWDKNPAPVGNRVKSFSDIVGGTSALRTVELAVWGVRKAIDPPGGGTRGIPGSKL